MDVRIGFKQSPQVVEVEMPDDADRAELKKSVEAAMQAGTVVWLTDQKGKEIAIPADSISFFEVGVPNAERKIGFGA